MECQDEHGTKNQPPLAEFPLDEHLGVVAWTVGLHLLILSALVWPEESLWRDFLMVGKIGQAGVFGFWVVLGPGSYQRRVSAATLFAMLSISIDWLAIDRNDETIPLLYGLAWSTVFLSSAAAGLIGSIVLRLKPSWLVMPRRFSILYIAGWTLVIGMLLATARGIWEALPWRIEADLVGYGILLLFFVIQGLWVGVLCWPAMLPRDRPLVPAISAAFGFTLLLICLEWSAYLLTAVQPRQPYAHQTIAGYSTYLDNKTLIAAFPTLKLGLILVTLGTWMPWRESLQVRGDGDE